MKPDKEEELEESPWLVDDEEAIELGLLDETL